MKKALSIALYPLMWVVGAFSFLSVMQIVQQAAPSL